jgi:cell division protein FtsA
MARNISTGIDVGTHQVKVVIGEYVRNKEKDYKRIIGTGSSESKGLRYGYIVNTNDVTRSVVEAINQAEKTAKIKVRSANISIGGVSVEGITSTGSTVISRADSEITNLDVDRALQSAESSLPQAIALNRKILHKIPLSYKIDGKEALGKPVGMKGMKLEVKILFITCLEQHLNDLIHSVEDAGIEVADIIASPLAAALVTLTSTQRVAGVVLANIGSETVSIVVYENDIPISLKVFPIGSTDITNDIALGLQIPLEEAEDVKIRGPAGASHPRKKLEEIVVARLTDIFELIESHLKKIDKNQLLPAGIVLTGGGSGIATIEDLAKAALKLPSRIGSLHLSGEEKASVRDASWTVAYGLCLIGLSGGFKELSGEDRRSKKIRDTAISIIKRFLP